MAPIAILTLSTTFYQRNSSQQLLIFFDMGKEVLSA